MTNIADVYHDVGKYGYSWSEVKALHERRLKEHRRELNRINILMLTCAVTILGGIVSLFALAIGVL